MSIPLVSIICCTYNHELYIRQCLDGFVMQKTNFPFEVLIHDDASTDKTAEIIKEYELTYPDIIKPIYQTENQYRKKIGILKTFQFPRVKGKYVAICEGDDYWTDSNKLQCQVDFLEKNRDYTMCSHNYYSYFQDKVDNGTTISKHNQTYGLHDLVSGVWLFQPLTVMFRKSSLNVNDLNKYNNYMDVVMFYLILKNGPGYYFGKTMGVYRIHHKGVWSGVSRDTQLLNECNARLAIDKGEQSRESAKFILTQFEKLKSRRWLIKHFNVTLKLIVVLMKQYGFRYVSRLLIRRMLYAK